MAAVEGTVAEFSGFQNFEERKRKSKLLMSFPKIVNQMGSFREKRKKNVFSLLPADARYFQIYAINVNPHLVIDTTTVYKSFNGYSWRQALPASYFDSYWG